MGDWEGVNCMLQSLTTGNTQEKLEFVGETVSLFRQVMLLSIFT